jgi:D-glycero-alpha-D-manno-heptose-7-phosphate kinase
MIISRTPLRVSFVGGGSDLPAFYRAHGGAVLSMSINRYIYLSMHKNFDSDSFILKYSKVETPRNINEIEHRIIRQVFTDLGINGVDFNSSADVPAGTGLGSSSCFTVGLINLCNAYMGRYESRSELARKACIVEIDKLGEPIGKQDQYGCALGGINFIQFNPDESVDVEAIALTQETRRRLEDNLLMIYLGGTRSASAVLAEQSRNMASNDQVVENMKAMVKQAYDLRTALPDNIDVLGQFLHDGWERKKRMAAGISTSAIDSMYQRARDAGATGGKLLGAGASGFLLVYAPGEAKQEVRSAMGDLPTYDVGIDSMGSAIIYSD